ncbi:MAG: hypothetical protein WCI04_04405 [archaeon]
MSGNYSGVIIEESLADKSVLKKVKIVSTKISIVEKRHETPWVKQWTMHVVEIPVEKADLIAEELSKSLTEKHSWYADFKSPLIHYIVYRGKIFKVDRRSKEQCEEAKKYGLSIGIPAHQIDFSPIVD